jgi:4-hydroxy-3-methylbut-2-en-1-yl diphosphate synthase IspG/GcpE
MTTTLTHDTDATLEQIERCVEAGAQIVRVAVPEERDATALPTIVKRAAVPIVADIHFNYRFALAAVDAGVAKVRINPGNIGNEQRIAQVLSAAKAANVPIRIGVNEGSLETDLLEKYPSPTAEALVESAMRHVKICEAHDFTDYEGIVTAAEALLEQHGVKIPVAVMGCEVNGPGETRNAEVGIHLGGKELAVLKIRGERVRTFRGKDEVNPQFLANALLAAAMQVQNEKMEE